MSVIVPFHGPEPFIERCIESLLAQRYPVHQRELIFVDNGGSAAARTAVRGHPSVRFIDETARGPYAARNAGVRAATGDILAFTDADCAVAPDWLDAIAEAMRDDSVQVVAGSYRGARDTFAAKTLAAYENEKNRYIFGGADERLYYGYTNNMAVRADLFRRVGPFLPRLRGSDAIFVRNVVKRHGCEAVAFIDAMTVRHLEVGGAGDYCRKVFVHARSIRALGAASGLRPLTLGERLRAFSRTVAAERLSPVGAGALLAILAVGMAAWELGTLARWPEEPPPEAPSDGA